MKVGILSMQRIFNYGSFLQAYGLKRLLEEAGCQVEFVDYTPGPCLVAGEKKNRFTRKLSKVLEVMRCRAPLAERLRFIRYKKNYAANYYPYLGITEDANLSPELELLVIGSDEVFNCVQSNTNVGFTPALFGQGICAKRRVSYAASFGNTDIGKLRQYGVDGSVKQWLSELDAVSVRDKNSEQVVGTLTGQQPQTHLDPVLAYDFMGKCDAIPQTVPEQNYMILYGYSGRFTREECDAVRAFAQKRGLKVLCIGGVQDLCDQFVDCDPFTVIAYFRNAEFVVTDTFHGTILSAITQRRFVSIVRSEGYGNSQKLTDLLERLDLQTRRLEKLEDLEKKLEEPVDYPAVEKILADQREKSRSYLQQQIRLCREEQQKDC